MATSPLEHQAAPWAVLSACLFLFTFGLRGLFSLLSLAVLGPLSLLSSGLLALYANCRVSQDSLCSRLQPQRRGRLVPETARGSSIRTTLTGSAAIDRPLQDMLGYVIRDYVNPWYDKISTDQTFINEVRAAGSEVVSRLADRMASVDWIPYLTTR